MIGTQELNICSSTPLKMSSLSLDYMYRMYFFHFNLTILNTNPSESILLPDLLLISQSWNWFEVSPCSKGGFPDISMTVGLAKREMSYVQGHIVAWWKTNSFLDSYTGFMDPGIICPSTFGSHGFSCFMFRELDSLNPADYVLRMMTVQERHSSTIPAAPTMSFLPEK